MAPINGRRARRCCGPCTAPVHFFPVSADGVIGPRHEGTAVNIALNAIGFTTRDEPACDYVYVTLAAPSAPPFAVLTRLYRKRPHPDGGFYLGGAFMRTRT